MGEEKFSEARRRPVRPEALRQAVGEEEREEEGKEEGDKEDEGLGKAGGEKEIEEEGRRATGVPGPRRVSQEEREEHERTHLPYRSWCEICVKARGRKRAHLKQKEGREKKNWRRCQE